jgi:hypothetical protein
LYPPSLNIMRNFLDRAAVSFAAGAFGALVNSVAVWAAGQYGLTARIGVAIAPALTAGWLYPRLVWGGLWGFLFLLPLRGSWWLRGLIVSLAPSAFQLLWVFPHETAHGLFGLRLGAPTPLFVLAANAVWGLAAAGLLRATGRA